MDMFVTFFLCLVSTVWTPVEGQSEVIGSSQPIIASPGDDVILPCHLNPELDVQGLTVEWSKPDLKLDTHVYVHVYRHRCEDFNMKNLAYIGRTQLFMDQLEHGDISLKIMNVTLADEGRYRCFLPKLNSRVQSAVIQLVVDSGPLRNPPSSAPARTEKPQLAPVLQTPGPPGKTYDVRANRFALISSVVVFCIVLAIVCAYLFKQRSQNSNMYDIAQSNPA